MRTFSISPASNADLGDVTALFRAYAQSLSVDLGAQGFEHELASLPGDYAPPKGALLIARDASGTAAGCVATRPLSATVCEMKRLYVAPVYRGTGLGAALVQHILSGAAGLGYREMKLDTLPHMQGAISLYRRFGFEEIAPYGTHPYAGLICLAKSLDDVVACESAET